MKTFQFKSSICCLLLPAICSLFIGAASPKTDGSRSAYSAGQSAPPFEARTIEGKTVKFPGDYKGKVVLLDFWATWCGPCRRELPNLTSTYEQYHAKGFEVLGVSLDRAREGPNLIQFTKDNNMGWPQIYDGLFWKAAVAVKYGVHAIPCPVLVDGDTGIILAEGPDALGHKLSRTVEKVLASKAKK